ncbi:MAG: MFS transporter [bacterium]
MPQEHDPSFEADRAIRSLKTFTFFLFATVGVWGPYLALFYREQGLNGKAIGVLGAILPLTVIFLPPVWGYISDRARDPRRIQMVCVTVSGLALLPCVFGGSFWFFLPFIVLFSFFNSPLLPLNDGQIFAGVAAYGGDYGRIRVWGSLGFNSALVLISAFFLFTSRVHVIFLVWVVLILATLWSLRDIPNLPSRLRRGEYLKGIKLLRSRQFVVFLIGVLINRMTMTSMYLFLSIYLRELDLPLYSIGLIWAIGPMAELVFFHYGNRMLRILGVKGLLVISLVAAVLRLGILSLAPPTWIILVSQLLHCLTFAANHLGAVTYVDSNLPPRMRASGQTILAAIAMGMGSSIGASLGGYFFDVVGILVSFRIFSVVAALGVLFLVLSFHPKEQVPRRSK